MCYSRTALAKGSKIEVSQLSLSSSSSVPDAAANWNQSPELGEMKYRGWGGIQVEAWLTINWFLSHLHKKKESEKAGLPDGRRWHVHTFIGKWWWGKGRKGLSSDLRIISINRKWGAANMLLEVKWLNIVNNLYNQTGLMAAFIMKIL